MFPAGSGGQSKLVLPKSVLVPFTVHGSVARGPLEQVPSCRSRRCRTLGTAG
jgi:hypothetical protein